MQLQRYQNRYSIKIVFRKFNSIFSKKRLTSMTKSIYKKNIKFLETHWIKHLNITQIKRLFRPCILSTHVRIYTLPLVYSKWNMTNGLINESRACKKEAWFLHWCTCIYAPIFVRGPLEIHVKHIKNLVAPALIIERSLPYN